jgi:hypothetical protein
MAYPPTCEVGLYTASLTNWSAGESGGQAEKTIRTGSEVVGTGKFLS